MENTKNLASSYGNIGMIYNLISKPDSALHYNLMCMEIFEEMQDQFALGTIYNNIALVYYDLRNFEKSLEYHQKSLNIKNVIGDKNGIGTSHVNIGNILIERKKYSEAVPHYQKALNTGKEIGAPLVIMNAHKGLAKAFGELEQFEQALLEYIAYPEIEDSLNNLEAKQQVAELETKFETAEKEKLLLEEKQKRAEETRIAQIQEERQNLIIAAVVIIALLVLVFAFVLFKRLKITQKQKAIIEDKNRENQLLLGEIHHRVKNNLQMISSLLNLQQRDIRDDQAKSAVIESRDRVRSVALLHKMLYQNNDLSGVDMRDFTGVLSSELCEVAPMEINRRVEVESLILDVETAIPIALILNELMVNSVKYAFEGISEPKITIQLKESQGTLLLTYADNGIGKQNSAAGSFGSNLVDSLTRQLKGTMQIENDNGTTYRFEFKKYRKAQ